MPRHPSHRVFRLLAPAIAAVVLGAAGAVSAQGDDDPAMPFTGGPSSQAEQANPASDNDGGDHGEQPDSGSANSQDQPPSEKLPQPKSSDYGAQSYNAPSDQQLDQFSASHPPSGPNDDDVGGSSADKPSDRADSSAVMKDPPQNDY